MSEISNKTKFLHVIEMGLGAWQWGDRFFGAMGKRIRTLKSAPRLMPRLDLASVLWIPRKSTDQATPSACRASSLKRRASQY